jgi:hypothetical protein
MREISFRKYLGFSHMFKIIYETIFLKYDRDKLRCAPEDKLG